MDIEYILARLSIGREEMETTQVGRNDKEESASDIVWGEGGNGLKKNKNVLVHMGFPL